MPPLHEGQIVVVIGIHDHGPAPPGIPSIGIRTEQIPSPIHGVEKALTNGYARTLSVVEGDPIAAWLEPPHEPNFEAARSMDVLWYGTPTHRREVILQDLAKRLEGSKFSIERPLVALWGAAKWQALCDAKIVLNVHAYDGPSCETWRPCEAIAAGALLVSEPLHGGPWTRGLHYVSAESTGLADALLTALQRYPETIETRRRAYARWREIGEAGIVALAILDLVEKAGWLAA